MIITNPSTRLNLKDRTKYLSKGVLIDTNILLIYFLSKFCTMNEDKKYILKELIEIDEIFVPKNSMLSHTEFIDFGNDISLLLATEEQIKKNKYSTILSFDGRFVNKFFEKTDNILAFNMEVLSYQF